MQRYKTIAAIWQSESGCYRTSTRSGQVRQQGVDHHIADEPRLEFRYAFTRQVRQSSRFGDEQQVGDGISENPVDLLWHCPVETAQTRFDMHDRNTPFNRGERARHRALDISDHHCRGRSILEEMGFVGFENACGLDAVRSRSSTEMNVGCGNIELFEEHVA